MEVFLRYRSGGLIHGGAYFQNFNILVRNKIGVNPALK